MINYLFYKKIKEFFKTLKKSLIFFADRKTSSGFDS